MWDFLHQLLKKRHRACYLKALSLLHTIEVNTVVEIGVFRGKNAAMLREVFPTAHLYLIDPWKPDVRYIETGNAVSKEQKTYDDALCEVQERFKKDGNVTIIQKPSVDAAMEVPDHLDLVFIDANHDYEHVKQNIETWERKVRAGGILSGHNYGHPRMTGVSKAVEEKFGTEFIRGQDQVWAKIIGANRDF